MKHTCGCCGGIEPLTPASTANPPGLAALAYRVGTHGSFFETMLAKLSTLGPLRPLTARLPDDPAIALLDAWAAVADVLTFYQERIANEGYLRTATERRSLLELARLVGYRPRPGVAASTHLAYTLEGGAMVTVPKGSRAQSVPGPGELPQTFETADDLHARGEWNVLRPRLTQPTVIVARTARLLPKLFLAGTTTRLAPNDRLVLVFGETEGKQAVLRVALATPDPAADRTEVTLQRPTASLATMLSGLAERVAALRADAPGGPAARRIDQEVLVRLAQALDPRLPPARPTGAVEEALAALRHARAATRGPVLGPWLDRAIAELETAPGELRAATPAAERPPAPAPAAAAGPGAAGNGRDPVLELGGLLGPLRLPPSRPPARSSDLERSATALFALGSDLGPQLLVTLDPSLSGTLYQAWANAKVTPSAPLDRLEAARVRAAPFGATAPRKPRLVRGLPNGESDEWPLDGLLALGIQVGYRNSLPAALLIEIVLNGLRGVGRAPLTGAAQRLPIRLGSDQVTVDVSEQRPADAAPSLRLTLSGPFSRVVTVTGPPPAGPIGVAAAAGGPLEVAFDDPPGLTLSPPAGGAESGTVGSRQVTAELHPTGAGSTEPGTLNVNDTGPAAPNVLPLDALYEGIIPGSWVVVERAGSDQALVRKVLAVDSVAKAAYNLAAKVTQLTLDGPWLSPGTTLLSALRDLTVHARSEPLALAAEPRDDDVAGAEIALDRLYDGLQSGRSLVVTGERTDLPGSGDVAGAELVMLAGVNQGVDADRPGDTVHTTIQLAKPLAFTYRRATVRIWGNVVRATHGESTAQVLGGGDGGQAMQAFTLRRSPVTYLAAATALGAESTLEVRVDDARWDEADNLVWLGPTDHGYVTRTDETDATTVVFGDGVHGARLPTGAENVKATYRVGIGRPGNVRAGQISQLQTKPLAVTGVTNPRPATGGADRDSQDQARRNIPLAAMALDRLVSVSDYEDFARARAGIGKASARRLSDGARTLVHLTIAGVDDVPIDPASDLFQNLRLAISRFGDPSQPAQLAVRELALLVVSASVHVRPDQRWELLEPKVRAALLDRFSFERRELGQDVLLSEVTATVQALPGVADVEVDALAIVPEAITPADLAALPASLQGPPPARIVMELARLDPDGTIRPAQLALLSPALADTLILKEARP